MEDPLDYLRGFFQRSTETELGEKVCDLDAHETMMRESLTAKFMDIEKRKKSLMFESKDVMLANEKWWNAVLDKYDLANKGEIKYEKGALYKSVQVRD